MKSRHKKQRQWRKEILAGNEWINKKGETVGAVHPSIKRTLNPSNRASGGTNGTLSKAGSGVN